MHINWLGPVVRDWLTARLLPSVPFCITEHNELAKRPRPKLRNRFHVCSVVVRVGYSIHPLLSWATKHLLRDQRYDQQHFNSNLHLPLQLQPRTIRTTKESHLIQGFMDPSHDVAKGSYAVSLATDNTLEFATILHVANGWVTLLYKKLGATKLFCLSKKHFATADLLQRRRGRSATRELLTSKAANVRRSLWTEWVRGILEPSLLVR